MVGEIKPNYEGIKFSQTAVLIRYENMSKNKQRDNDPDYYKIVLDVDGQIVETSAVACAAGCYYPLNNTILYFQDGKTGEITRIDVGSG